MTKKEQIRKIVNKIKQLVWMRYVTNNRSDSEVLRDEILFYNDLLLDLKKGKRQ